MLDATAVAGTHSPKLRADASRNRERITFAAREAIVEHGSEVPFDEVARRAGVGNATLYRHFSDRAELVRQVALSVTLATARRAEDALATEADAFSALERFVFAAVEERIGALCPMISSEVDVSDREVRAAFERLQTAIAAIVDRAQQTGQMRDDIAVGDLIVALSQLTRPLPGPPCAEFDTFVHRHLQLFLDGLRAPARSTLVGTAATLEDLQNCRQHN